MAEGRDLIVAAALMDTLVFADGRAETNIAGGAGLHALAGAALFSDDALLVTGTGEDLDTTFGPWLERNGLSRDGLRYADPHTPRNLLRYIDERTRTETPIYGDEHFQRVEPNASDLERSIEGARSAYIFRNAEPSFWDRALALHKTRKFLLLWEIGLDACSPSQRPTVQALAAEVDALSLNLEEARLLFAREDETELVRRLAAWPVPCIFLRVGGRGSYVIEHGGTTFVPSVSVDPVDVTGGGNAYSGAALVGLADGRGGLMAAAMGAVAASVAIRQLGLPEPRDPQLRIEAHRALSEMMTQIQGETTR